MLPLIICALILTSHVPAALPFFRKVGRSQVPAVVDFACVGLLVYFDLGLVLEALGVEYEHPYFEAFFSATDSTLLIVTVVLVATPWLLRLGNTLTVRHASDVRTAALTRLRRGRRWIFYPLALGLSGVLALLGFTFLQSHAAIWLARAKIGAQFGTAILIFYIPLHILAFYARQSDSRRLAGRMVLLLLGLMAVIAPLPIGQRTNALLPALILGLFAFKLSAKRLVSLSLAGVVAASLLFSVYKWQGQGQNRTVLQSVASTVYLDFHRANVLAYLVEEGGRDGSRFLPYPGVGYVHGVLYFIPRSLVPFKGEPTSEYLTAYLTGTEADTISWTLACGMIEELVANFGLLSLLPGLLAWGLLMGWLQSLSDRLPYLIAPTRLAMVWGMGYVLPTLLYLFGVMFAVSWILGRLFAEHGEVSRGDARGLPMEPARA